MTAPFARLSPRWSLPASGRRTLVAVLFCLAAALAQAAPTYPALSGRIVDAAGVVPETSHSAVESKLIALEDKSGIQIVVASVKSLEGYDVESYANGLFRAWKLGEAKKNNGVLFLIAPNDRKMRIEVGYGLEGALTDALSKVILTTAVAPRFKVGDFGGGVERGVDAIIEVLSGDAGEWTKRATAGARGEDTQFDKLVPFIILALFIFIFATMVANSRGPAQRGYRGYRRGGRGPVIFSSPSDSMRDGDSGGSSWGGGSSGDDFSGGGGSSGGGGASGDW